MIRVFPLTVLEDLVEFLPWFIAASSLVVLASIVFKSFPPVKPKTMEETKPTPSRSTPSSVRSTVSASELEETKNELRTLRIERDIVSYALTRLFEAEAQGKITQEERDRLLSKYKDDMKRLEKDLEEKELVVNLHELEGMQSNLLEMFQKRFDEISNRIEEIRSELGIEMETIDEISPRTEEKEEETIPPESGPTVEAPPEDKIRKIREEVMRDLEKLEQMEVEEIPNELDRQDETEDSN